VLRKCNAAASSESPYLVVWDLCGSPAHLQ